MDCNKGLAEKNNAATVKAFENGYVPFNINRLNKQERISQGFSFQDSPSAPKPGRPAARKSPRSFVITNPTPGELYLGYWNKTGTRYPVIVFPFRGDIAITGLQGSLASIGLLANAPRCVRVNKMTQEIEGWARGYEDGGALVTEREFPVVYFDRKQYEARTLANPFPSETNNSRTSQVGWLPAKHLARFDFRTVASRLMKLKVTTATWKWAMLPRVAKLRPLVLADPREVVDAASLC